MQEKINWKTYILSGMERAVKLKETLGKREEIRQAN